MVVLAEGSNLGKSWEITIIKIGVATRNISDVLQIAFSEMGLNLITTKDITSAAPMVTGSQPGGRVNKLRVLETAYWDLIHATALGEEE